ncbi:MAG: peptidoglycan/xylan/chitin deacetylase (PgdA/CDA1 family) [Acidimicrobiales bacterium]|jgi:peptidoglycan/xylan/chitin deacetylase (PgdA/CDA1 family)
MRIKSTSKTIVIYCCAVLAYFVGYKKQPAILMYHSFDTQKWRHGVSPAELERQLLFLVKERKVVPLSDIVAFTQGKAKVLATAIAITVDDGYEDTYTVLFPFAKKYNTPFTLFLTTDLSLQAQLGNLPRPTWNQLVEMSNSPLVSIQVHGHSHINFPEVMKQRKQDSEILQCKALIQQKLGTIASMVAYPAGNHDTFTAGYLQKEGYEAAFTTHIGVVQKGDNPLLLNRIVVDRNTSLGLFKARLSIGLGLYTRLVYQIKKIYA